MSSGLNGVRRQSWFDLVASAHDPSRRLIARRIVVSAFTKRFNTEDNALTCALSETVAVSFRSGTVFRQAGSRMVGV